MGPILHILWHLLGWKVCRVAHTFCQDNISSGSTYGANRGGKKGKKSLQRASYYQTLLETVTSFVKNLSLITAFFVWFLWPGGSCRFNREEVYRFFKEFLHGEEKRYWFEEQSFVLGLLIEICLPFQYWGSSGWLRTFPDIQVISNKLALVTTPRVYPKKHMVKITSFYLINSCGKEWLDLGLEWILFLFF